MLLFGKKNRQWHTENVHIDSKWWQEALIGGNNKGMEWEKKEKEEKRQEKRRKKEKKANKAIPYNVEKVYKFVYFCIFLLYRQ